MRTKEGRKLRRVAGSFEMSLVINTFTIVRNSRWMWTVAPSHSAIPSAAPVRASLSRSSTRSTSVAQRKVSRHCASAVVWESRCASKPCRRRRHKQQQQRQQWFTSAITQDLDNVFFIGSSKSNNYFKVEKYLHLSCILNIWSFPLPIRPYLLNPT